MVAGESVPIAVVPITVDVQHFTSVLQARNPQPNRLFSIGTMFWLPSSEGVSWWLRNGYELLRARYPDLTYDIVGARPPHNLQALAAQHEGVTVHGYVADTLPFWTSATALAVPILSGGGVRVKILEAMAMGVPLVSTTVGCEGLNVRHGEHLLVADTPEAFAHAIARIFQDTALASQLARNARQFVLEHYDAKVALRTLDAAYEQARGLSERKPGKEYRP